MRISLSLITFSLVSEASAHYVLNHFIVNGTIHQSWKYVRRVSPFNQTNDFLGPRSQPHYDLSSPNIWCGRDAGKTGPQTDIATVVAGQEIGFRPDLWQDPFVMFHEGPLIAYLSKSPEQSRAGLQAYEGDSDWFKINQMVPYSKKNWFRYLPMTDPEARVSEYNFTVPATTPPGFYLLRIESIYTRTTFNQTQFYMNCAQVEIVGSGNPKTEPGPMVKFPGAYSHSDPGIHIPENVTQDLYTLYKYPGPPLWEG